MDANLHATREINVHHQAVVWQYDKVSAASSESRVASRELRVASREFRALGELNLVIKRSSDPRPNPRSP